MPSDGLTTSTAGTVPIPVIGVSSLSGSKAGGSVKLGGMSTDATEETSSTYPSGAALITVLVPMMPLAPALFSMTTGCPISAGELVEDAAREEIRGPAGRERHVMFSWRDG